MGKIRNCSIRHNLTIIDDEPIIENLENLKDKVNRICGLSSTLLQMDYKGAKNEYDFLTIINCHAYSTGLWKEDIWDILFDYIVINDRNLIDCNFMSTLIPRLDEHLNPIQNDLVIYFDSGGKVTHSGICKNVSNNLIESKWGNYQYFPIKKKR